jgi:N-acylneuraminate cytidylyltransferase
MAYQALPPVYVQNASLEIAWSRVPLEGHNIAGAVITPFLTEGFEGFDLNEAPDWWYAEKLAASGEAALPVVSVPAYTAGRTSTAF